MANLYLQTLPETQQQFSNAEISGFLASIEDAGGRQDAILTNAISQGSPIAPNEVVLGQVSRSNGTWDEILSIGISDTSTIEFTAGLNEYYLFYIDNSNWYLFETGVESQQITVLQAGSVIPEYIPTNVVASRGGYTGTPEFQIYESAGGFDVLDFLDFFITSTPTETEYEWPSNIGRTITDADGDTERIVGGAVFFNPGMPSQVPLFSFAHTDGDFAIGDRIRIRIWEDDVDQDTTTPLIDVQKTIWLGNISGIGPLTGDLNIDRIAGGTRASLSIFTEAGVNSLTPFAVEIAPVSSTIPTLVRYFATDQVRIDRTQQVVATGFRTASEGSAVLIPSEQQDILLDIQSTDNEEVGLVYGDLSQSFIIPPTEAHNKFFESAFDVGGQIIPGTASGVGMLLNSGEETLVDGTLSLRSWDPQTGYEVQINSGVVSLSDALEGKKLADADWSDLDHTYSIDTWRAQDVAQNNPPYYYPLVDRGFDEDGRPRIPDDATLARATVTTQADDAGSYVDRFGNITNSSIDALGNSNAPRRNARVIGPSPYFGEVSTGESVQGFITHPSTPLRIDQLAPAFRLDQVLDRIFEQAGATCDDSFMDMLDDVYIYPLTQSSLGVSTPSETNPTNGFRAVQSTVTFPVDVIRQVNTSDDGVSYRFGGDNQNGDTLGTQSFTFPATKPTYFNNDGEFVATEDGSYEFNFSGDISNLDDWGGRGFPTTSNKLRYQAVIRKVTAGSLLGGTVIASHPFTEIEDQSGDNDQSFDITGPVRLNEGDRVVAQIEVTRRRAPNSQTIRATLSNAVFRTTLTPRVWEGLAVDASLQWGEVESLDVLLAIQQRLNLVISPDKSTRSHYNADQKFDWYNAGRRLDWSEKVDVDSMVYSPLIPEQHKTINFADADSDDRFAVIGADTSNELAYGSLIFTDADDSQSDGDATIGDFFSPTIVAGFSEAGSLVKSTVANPTDGIPHIYDFNGEEGKTIEGGIRIGYRKAITLPGPIYYGKTTDDPVSALTGEVNTFSNIDDTLADDLNYSSTGDYSLSTANAAYNKYWKPETDHIYDKSNRKLICDIFFTPEEYSDLQLNDTIGIFGSNYIINKISGYNLSRPGLATVELITYQDNFNTVFTERTNRFVTEPEDTKTFVLGINVNPMTDSDNDGVLESITGVVKTDEFVHPAILATGVDTGNAAETETFTFNLQPTDQWNTAASDLVTNVTSLTGVAITVDDADNGGIDVTVTLTGQLVDTYMNLILEPEVTAKATDEVLVTLNVTEDATGIANGSISTPTLIGSGRPGATVTLLPVFSPVNTPTNSYELNFPLIDNSGSITGLTTSYADRGIGVQGVYVYQIPENQLVPVVLDVEVNGTSTQLPAGTVLSNLQLTFTENPITTNVSIRDRVVNIPGIASTQINLDTYIDAAFGFEITADEFNFSTVLGTNSSRFQRQVGEDQVQHSNATVLIPSQATFPTSGTSSLTIPVTMGDPEIIGTPRISRTVTYTATPAAGETSANYTQSDPSDLFIGSPDDATLQNSAQHIITAAEGRTFSSSAGVNVTASSGVSNITKQRIDNTIVLTFDVDASTSLTAVGSIAYTVTTRAEQFRATVILNNQIGSSTLGQSSFSWGFDESTAAQALPQMTTTLTSSDSTRGFNSSADVPTATGSDIETSSSAVVTADSISSGVLTLAVTPTIPAGTAENVTFTVDLDGSSSLNGAPNQVSGTTISTTIPHAGIPATGGTISIFVTCDGAWETGGNGILTGGGRYSPTSGFGDGVINVELPYLSENTNSFGIGIVIRTTDRSASTQNNLQQSDQFGQRIISVATAADIPDPAQPGIIYVYPEP